MKETIVIKSVKPWQLAKGHQGHRSGAGTHSDRRMSRLKTRASQQRRAIDEKSY
jgi:hypothetical protein